MTIISIDQELAKSPTRFLFGTSCALLLTTLAASQPVDQRNSMPASTEGLEAPDKNGARIYFTGVSERGTLLSHTGGPDLGGAMMGGGMMGAAMASG